MKGTLAASTAVHLALLSVLFFVRPGSDMVVPGPDVVQVALLGEPPLPAPAPVVKANDAVVPDESDGVRIEKPRAKPKPEVKQQTKQPDPKAPVPPQRDTPPPPPGERRTVLPYAPVGAGLSGQVAVDDANFEFAYYLQMVRAQIARNWTPPAGSSPGARAEVYFRVSRAGEITGLRLEVSSGGEYFDQTALRAVV
ncbi:MAG TPA: TonB C-terminal domain-containing protein, partial [Gemmatimonadales bacterium]|nr:TonB C-terminal domain-containing protein [Gemmatimonadales bacterium]